MSINAIKSKILKVDEFWKKTCKTCAKKAKTGRQVFAKNQRFF